MAHLYAYFDESGKQADHPIVAFSGLVAGFERTRVFQKKWAQLLRSNHVEEFHAVDALRHSKPYGSMKTATADERARDILPFIREITEGLELGISFAVDVKAYQSPTLEFLHQAFGTDPHYFGFFVAINALLTDDEIPRHLTIGLILHDEEKKAIECYRLLKKMKRSNKHVKERITSICFSDDTSPAVQASDLFAYFTRAEAERRFAGKEYPYGALFSEFENVSKMTGHHLHFSSGFYDAEELSAYQKLYVGQMKAALRKSL